MAIVVQKYGGSSVADAEKIRAVAKRVAERRRQGDAIVVVVSAMGDTTDELLALARSISDVAPRRELDMLLTAGERISMALLSMALNADGIEAISFTGSQSGIITTDSHSNARILEVKPLRIREELAKGKVVIVAGYQGVSTRREVTTLGRGGSDTTAVALAAALSASACEIYSDVDGVFTSDPRVVPQARKLTEIAWEEMQELADFGARVLNAQAVEFARRAGIAIEARSTFGGGEGTRVAAAPPATRRVIGIAGDRETAVVEVVGVDAEALVVLWRLFEQRGVTPRQTACMGGSLHAILSLENMHGIDGLRAALETRYPGSRFLAPAGIVSAVGAEVGSDAATAARALEALSGAGIPVRGVIGSPNRLSWWIDAERVDEGMRALHAALIA